MPPPEPIRLRRIGQRWLAVAAAAAVVAVLAPHPASAQDDAIRQLEALERSINESRLRQQELARAADVLARELGALRDRLIAAADLVQTQEEEIVALGARLAALEAEERSKSAVLAARRGELAVVLASLSRLSRQPPVSLAVSPGDALAAVHASILLASVVPELQDRARAIGSDLDAVSSLRAEIALERAGLAAAQQRLAEERRSLALLLDEKGSERARTEAEREAERSRLARLAAEAADLRDLLGRLQADDLLAEGPPPGSRPFAEARGRLSLPARGRLVTVFGDLDDLGLPSRGLTIEPLPGAQVVAPYDGKIVFSGPFRSYGQLLIIAHGGGYHTLIAGLSRIDGTVGQWLLAGEPVGQANPDANESSAIYVELRWNGEPINPLPWLAAR